MKKYFAISDTHSFYDEVCIALNNKGFDLKNPDHFIILCGDAFDRGDQADDMLYFLKSMHSLRRLIYVRGNHEDLLSDCVMDIKMGRIGYHHWTNKTIDTIAQFMNLSEYDILHGIYDRVAFIETMSNVLDFIDSVCVDYFELGKTVFVHGWLPTTIDTDGIEIVHENWRDGDWKDARWPNGMQMHYLGVTPKDMDTVVCGHWHTSFAWHHYEDACPEWGDLSIFDPYIKKNNQTGVTIVALDGCVPQSRKVNCVVFDDKGVIIDAG